MPRFAPDSIMGLIWKETWDKLELSTKEPDEIQKEYVNFVRKYKITAPCWVPIEPYPVPSISEPNELDELKTRAEDSKT